MKSLLKIIWPIGLFFVLSFILIKSLNLFTLNDITSFLSTLKAENKNVLSIVIIIILTIDLFIAIPTLSTCILSGYFLGFWLGSVTVIIGLFLTGFLGYSLGKLFGDKILNFVIKTQDKRQEGIDSFNKYGFTTIALCRISPILPELSACLAGITKMSFKKFCFAWSLNTIPYALISVYAGSISSIENPKPAIYASLGLYILLLFLWNVIRKKKK